MTKIFAVDKNTPSRVVWAQKWGHLVARGKTAATTFVCFNNYRIQYKRNKEAPVFESARSACYFTRYSFFTGKLFVLHARGTCAPV
jgi:hypothetical protein